MKLVTFQLPTDPGVDHVGAMFDEHTLVDLHSVHAIQNAGSASEPALRQARQDLGPDLPSLISRGDTGLEQAADLLAYASQGNAGAAAIQIDQIKFRPPIPRPGKIIAMGRNFSDHASETLAGLKEKFGREVKAPDTPMGFLKATTSLAAHEQDIVYPRVTQQLDYEVEMAIIIGRPGRYISADDAYAHVAGYAVFNDVSARDIQLNELKNGPLLLSKGLDTCGPFGPYLVTRDEVPDPHNLGIRLRVNGETRQDSTTARLMFKVPELVCYWSAMTLEAGDVIVTGTPEGVAIWRKPDPTPWYLKVGDVVEAEIDRVGLLRNRIAAEAA